MLDLGGREEDIAYPKALIECFLNTPSKKDVGTGGSQRNRPANFQFMQVCLNIPSNRKNPYSSEQTTFNKHSKHENVKMFVFKCVCVLTLSKILS